jgi:hypothetical protein
MSRPWTTQGRDVALRALAERRAASVKREPIRNEQLPAGSPMFLACIACGEMIPHPEDYLFRTELCVECGALHALGWLND